MVAANLSEAASRTAKERLCASAKVQYADPERRGVVRRG